MPRAGPECAAARRATAKGTNSYSGERIEQTDRAPARANEGAYSYLSRMHYTLYVALRATRVANLGKDTLVTYQAYEMRRTMTSPVYRTAALVGDVVSRVPRAANGSLLVRSLDAWSQTVSALQVTHERPAFGIESVVVAGETVPVSEETVFSTPFASLLRFTKPAGVGQPRVLILPGLAGHFATLVRDTVDTMLPDHDVDGPTGTTPGMFPSPPAGSASMSSSSTSWCSSVRSAGRAPGRRLPAVPGRACGGGLDDGGRTLGRAAEPRADVRSR